MIRLGVPIWPQSTTSPVAGRAVRIVLSKPRDGCPCHLLSNVATDWPEAGETALNNAKAAAMPKNFVFIAKPSPAKPIWSVLIWHQLSKATRLSLLPSCPQRNAKGEARRIAAASSFSAISPSLALSATAIFCINAQRNGQQSDRSLKVICWEDCHDQDLSDRLQRGRPPQPDIWLRWGNPGSSRCPDTACRCPAHDKCHGSGSINEGVCDANGSSPPPTYWRAASCPC
jgi:hypothetical protein